MASLVIFTSVTRNYLAKARVLARSVKRLHGNNVEFHCVIADFLAADDAIYNIQEFDKIVDMASFEQTLDTSWLFMHALVETCTTVKPLYLAECLANGADKVIYLDPDTRVFDSLQPVIDMLDEYAICLTPHIADVDFDRESISDNELSAAKHGVYNLGFFAVGNTNEGNAFARWWSDRVVNYGYAQTYMGCFTDQKICDFVPAYFDSVKIWRNPGLNVAHWNLNQREISRQDNLFTANANPLIFYHFSSYDSGVGEKMSMKYSAQTRDAVDAIWQIYKSELDELANFEYESMPWTLASFSDGTIISTAMRLYYRQHEHLQYRFENPFDAKEDSYLAYWFSHPECREFEAQWQASQAFLASFRFARTDHFLRVKLNAIEMLIKNPPKRLFVYGANHYGEEVYALAKSRVQSELIVIDRNSNALIGTQTAYQPQDFSYTDDDVIVICGQLHESAMRETIIQLSSGSPQLL